MADSAVTPSAVPLPLAPLRPQRAALAGAVAAAAVAVVAARVGLSPWGVLTALTGGVLVWVAAIDLEARLIPNRIVIPLAVLLAAAAVVLDGASGLSHAGAALVVSGALFVAALAKPGGIGAGDAKLGAVLGSLLAGDVVAALVLAFVGASLVGLVLVARYGRQALMRELPLAPFLAAGAILTLVLG